MRSFPNVMCYVCLAVFVLTPGAAFAQGGSGGLITKQWVGPSDSGQIGIQMIAPPNVPGIPAEAPISVMLAGLDGTVYTADVSAESAGGLSLDNVPPGVYTMLARGPGLVACYAIHVVPPPDGGFAESGQVLEIVTAALPPAGVRSAIIRYTPPSVDVPVQMDYDEGEAFVAGQASASNLHRVLQSDGG